MPTKTDRQQNLHQEKPKQYNPSKILKLMKCLMPAIQNVYFLKMINDFKKDLSNSLCFNGVKKLLQWMKKKFIICVQESIT